MPFCSNTITTKEKTKKHERRNGHLDFRPTIVGSQYMHKTRERNNYKGIQQQHDNKGNGEE